MTKLLARLLFALLPAIAVGGSLAALVNPPLGMAAFISLAVFGWDMTKPRPNRGEGL